MDCIYKDKYRVFEEKLRASLNDSRYKHSLGVCEECVKMAERFGADAEKAYVAGLLHDCAKCISDTDAYIKRYNVQLDDMTLKCIPVIHAPLGAVAAYEEYGIRDKEILNAIERHTVAGRDMTLLDKIVYVADMTEPARCYPDVQKLREAAEEDIEKAYAMAVKNSLLHNINKKSIIHPNTLDAWNEICEGRKGK